MNRPSLLALALVVAIPRVALADDEDSSKRAAEALFTEARRLMTEGNFGAACPMLRRSHKIDPALGTLVNLGLCFEKSGQTASAWLAYREAISLAVSKRDAPREQLARERSAALEPELSMVTVRVSPAAGSDVEISIDGDALSSPSWGVAFPIDPGSHVVRASAPGAEPFTKSFDAVARKNVEIDIPALVRAVEPPADPPAVVTRPATPPDAPIAPPPSRASVSTPVFILGGAGAVTLIAGAALGIYAKIEYDGADGRCRGDVCTSEGVAQRERAFDVATAATITVVTGAALVGAAVVVWSLGRRAPTVSMGPGTWAVRGTF